MQALSTIESKNITYLTKFQRKIGKKTITDGAGLGRVDNLGLKITAQSKQSCRRKSSPLERSYGSHVGLGYKATELKKIKKFTLKGSDTAEKHIKSAQDVEEIGEADVKTLWLD